MYDVDKRREHIGWIETALKATNADLSSLRIYAQSHFGPPDRVAFIVILGVDEDRERRRAIRSDATDLLRHLGYVVSSNRDAISTKCCHSSRNQHMKGCRCTGSCVTLVAFSVSNVSPRSAIRKA